MKTQFKNKRAFTLIELLIVIAIIGILFIVLVSKVDFATDKAKATGVQTDFRSFQVALDQVAKENSGFNMFGYNTGDTKRADFDTALPGYTYTNETTDRGDGIRNSYDAGDKNLNGKQDVNGQNGYTGTTEVFTGRKVYTEKWTEVYTLVKPGTTGLDANAIFALESAINKNLDPKLYITIATDGKITMANQARDPWKNEYHGAYISNAERDHGADRGAIIMYSNGPNGQHGSEHDITNGVVTVTVPGNNVNGKDDYSLVSCYTFTNGYGEVLNMSTGFSNNQGFMAGGSNSTAIVPGGSGNAGGNGGGSTPETPEEPAKPVVPGGNGGNNAGGNADGNGSTEPDVNESIPVVPGATLNDGTTLTWEELKLSENGTKYGYNAAAISDAGIGEDAFYECTRLTSVTIPDSVTTIGDWAFGDCISLMSVIIPNSVTSIGDCAFYSCESLTSVVIPDNLTGISENAFKRCSSLAEITVSENNKNYKSIDGNLYTKDGKTLMRYAIGKTDAEFSIPANVTTIGNCAFEDCESLTSVVIGDSVTIIGYKAFSECTNLTSIVIPDNVTTIGGYAFGLCSSLSSVTIGNSVTTIDHSAFDSCTSLTSITYRGTVSQWSAISLGPSWDFDVPATYVQCSNGQVNI